jgi:hypothetical protein
VLLCWSLAVGDRWALPLAVVIGSFVVQSHVGYAVPVGAVGIASLVLGIADGPLRPSRGRWIRVWRLPLVVSGVALLAMWLPVVVQQVGGDPRNLSAIVRFFRSSRGVVGAARGWRTVAGELGLRPMWVTGSEHPSPFTGELQLAHHPLPLVGVALVVLTVVAWRRSRVASRLGFVVLVLVTAAFVAVDRVVPPLYPYIVRWTWVVGMLALLATAWTAWEMIPEPTRRRAGHTVLAVSALLLVVSSGFAAARAAGARAPDAEWTPLLASARHGVLAAVPPHATVHIAKAAFASPAIGLMLERAGRRVVFDRGSGFVYGDHRVVGHGPRPSVVLQVAIDENAREELARHPTNVVAVADSLAPRDRAAVEAIRARFLTGAQSMADALRHFQMLPASVRARYDELEPRDHLLVVERVG